MREWLRRFRLPMVWGVILLISAALQTFTVLYDASVVGRQITTTQAIIQEASSHAMWLVLLPAIYWLQRRLPVWASLTNILAHIAATVPVSLAHVLAKYLLTAAATFLGSWLIYEGLVRRIGILRLLFGMAPMPPAPPKAALKSA